MEGQPQASSPATLPENTSFQGPGKWLWKDILLIAGCAALIILAGFAILRILAHFAIIVPGEPETQLILSLASLLLETLALVLPIYLFGVRRKNIPWSELGLRICRLEWVFAAGFLGILAIPLSGVVAAMIQLLLQKPLENPQLPFLVPAGSSLISGSAMLLLGGFLVPLAEEVFFRGLLYRWLRQHLGIAASILCSALIFAVLHGDFAVGGAAFVLGIMLAWVYEKSQSLWPAFIIHAINNSVKIVLLYVFLLLGLL